MSTIAKIHLAEIAAAALIVASAAAEGVSLHGVYHVQCHNSAGELLWEDTAPNVVTTLGKNDALDKYLAGSAYTAAFYLGLISSVSYSSVPVAADTHASHATWTECGATNAPNYSSGTRPTISFGSASSGSKVSTGVAFTMSSGGTVKGCLLSNNSTKDGTTGLLFSAGLFSGGDKVVSTSDVLTVTYTLNA